MNEGQCGADRIQAKDGADALEKCQDDDFDAFLVDVNMPGIGCFIVAMVRDKSVRKAIEQNLKDPVYVVSHDLQSPLHTY